MGVYTNNTKGWQYPFGVAVPPGESREIDGFNVVDETTKSEVGKDDDTPEALKLSIKKAQAVIDTITDINELRKLDDIERAGQNRSGMLTLIAERALLLDDANKDSE